MLSEGHKPYQLGAESGMNATGGPLTGRRAVHNQDNGGSKSTMHINKRKAQLVPELTVAQVKVLEEREKLERSAASLEMKASKLHQSHLGKT